MEKTKGAVQKQQVNSLGLSLFAVAFCIESSQFTAGCLLWCFALGLGSSQQAFIDVSLLLFVLKCIRVEEVCC